MAEIKPVSDELLAAAERLGRQHDTIGPITTLQILARLRKAEADLARLKTAIDEAEKHAPEAVHFIRAMASTQGGENE